LHDVDGAEHDGVPVEVDVVTEPPAPPEPVALLDEVVPVPAGSVTTLPHEVRRSMPIARRGRIASRYHPSAPFVRWTTFGHSPSTFGHLPRRRVTDNPSPSQGRSS
jgi:hypothetical protein